MPARARVSAGRVLGPRDDARDLLMTAALWPPDDARRAWELWLEGHDPAVPSPIAARWMPVVARNLESVGGNSSWSEILKRSRREAWVCSTRLLAAAEPVLAAFDRAGIDAVLLKGAALAIAVYPDRGVRPFGDVDVLVRPDSVVAARSILSDLGWTCERLAKPFPQTGRHSLDYRFRNGSSVDLHQYLLQECCTWEAADAGAWQRTEFTSDGDVRRRVLGPADQLLHVCVHGLRWSRVHAGTWVADAVEVLRRAGDRVAWDTLIDEARRRQLTFQLSQALRLVATVPGTTIPAHVFRNLGRSRVSWSDRVECYAKTRQESGPSGAWLFWRGWRRSRPHRSDSGGFLTFFAGFVGLDSRRQLTAWFARRVRNRWGHP